MLSSRGCGSLLLAVILLGLPVLYARCATSAWHRPGGPAVNSTAPIVPFPPGSSSFCSKAWLHAALRCYCGVAAAWLWVAFGVEVLVTPSLFPPCQGHKAWLWSLPSPNSAAECHVFLHPGLLSLGEAGGSSRQLGDRPCFLRKTRRRQRICWVFFPQFATRMCCLSFAFGEMLGLLGELCWGHQQGHTSHHSMCLVRCSRYS